jgi:tRNA-specific 2-thiouridylase
MIKKKPTVIIGLSGGIDSAVAAMLLKNQGYDLIGVFIKLWADSVEGKKETLNKCCSLETQMRAKAVCDQLQIPFRVINLAKEFKQYVVDYFLDSYKKGITPNPCVECNRTIKFGLMFETLQQYEADYFATGHYAKIEKEKNGYHLSEGKDKNKDQTYFLYTLTQKKLSKILFPLGNLTKAKVKEMAKELKVNSFDDQYKESQNLCFFPEDTPEEFLKRYLPLPYQQPGPIKTLQGDIIGEHKGLFRYTIGQRKGIEIGGQETPLYVIQLSMKDNTLIVGEEKDLYTSSCLVTSTTFISGKHPKKRKNLLIKTRYTRTPATGDIEQSKDKYIITFHQPVRAITPGQSAVFYRDEEIIGGGIITT